MKIFALTIALLLTSQAHASERITNLVCDDGVYRVQLQHYTGVVTGWHKMHFDAVEMWTARGPVEVESSDAGWMPGVSTTCMNGVTYDAGAGALKFVCTRAIGLNRLIESLEGLYRVTGEIKVQLNAEGHLLGLAGEPSVVLERRLSGEEHFSRLSVTMNCGIQR